MFASSSGSSGSGFLLNYCGAGGGLVHTEFAVPDSLRPLVDNLLGPAPEPAQPKLNVIRRAIDAVLKIGIAHFDAHAMILWVTEPDGTAHARGIGAPETIEALRGVDAEIGYLLDELKTRNVLNTTNVFVTSDHGFSTHVGSQSLTALLVEHGYKASNTSTDVVVADGALYVNEGGQTLIRAIVELLHQTDWVGPVFTPEGHIAGTLPFESIFWNHDRSADILTAADWSGEANEFGFEGQVMTPGVAGHGSASPFDIRATFIASGPAVKQGTQTRVPTGNVDLAPTLLHLLNIPIPEHMDGRVLHEVLVGGPNPASIQFTIQLHDVTSDDGGYRTVLHTSHVDGTGYVDFIEVKRDQ
jgi:hypothetical protein